MTDRADLHDQLVLFMQEEHRNGFLLANPLTTFTIHFWEHLAEFIAAQAYDACHERDVRMAQLTRQLSHCQRWLRWCTRFRGRHGGRGHV